MTLFEEHPRGATALTFGVLGLVLGVATLGAGLVLSPIAWGIGHRVLREMDAEPGTVWSNRGQAATAVWLGTIGTVLLVMACALVATFLALYWTGYFRMN